MNSIADGVKQIYKRLSPRTRGALIVLLIVIPDWMSRGGFWYGSAVASWPLLKAAYASPYGKLALIVLAFLLILLDQRRITHKKTAPRYTDSLQGRVLQLRDEVQQFLKDVGEEPPETKREPGMTERDYQIAQNRDAVNWSAKIGHGFALRFADRAKQLFHECGEAGTSHDMFGARLAQPVPTEADVKEVVADLTWLSNNV